MLGEYKVNRCTRQCHILKRPLREGEWYYSVVLETGDEFLRRDYSAESWNDPPDGAVGWWKSRMPTIDQKKLVLAPIAVLTDLLRQMAGQPENAKSRYLLALMLMRKRVVRPLAENKEEPDSEPMLRLEVVATGAELEVPVCVISRSESKSLRDELNTMLYCDAEELEELGAADNVVGENKQMAVQESRVADNDSGMRA